VIFPRLRCEKFSGKSFLRVWLVMESFLQENFFVSQIFFHEKVQKNLESFFFGFHTPADKQTGGWGWRCE
jgi:hypothetical protein